MAQGVPAANTPFSASSSTFIMPRLSEIKSLSEKYRDLIKGRLVYSEKFT